YTLDETRGQVNFGALSVWLITSVVATGTNMVCTYSVASGNAPSKNQAVYLTNLSSANNLAPGIITAINATSATAGTFTCVNALAVNQPTTAGGYGTVFAGNTQFVTAATNVSGNTWRYTYSGTVTGQAPAVGMRITISGMVNGGNNVTAYITSLAGGAGTFDIINTTGHAETGSS